MTEVVPLIEIRGGPRQRGIHYGEQASGLIRRSVDIYKTIMAKRGCDWPEARRLAQEFAPYIAEHSPDSYLELEGIAEGAQLPLEEIIVINGRSELMFGRNWPRGAAAAKNGLDDECTSILAMPRVTTDGHLLHGQNWDWRQECVESAIVLRVVPEQGPTLLTFVEAGGLARCGFNSAGVAITGNGLESDQDANRIGLPLSLIRRQALSGNNLHDALRAIIHAPRAVSNNMMVSGVDQYGAEAINLETAPDEVFFTYPQDGVLTHGNHFECPVARARLRDTGIPFSVCSLYRSQRARHILLQQSGSIDRLGMDALLRDKFSSPRGICRSPVPGRDGTVLVTVASILMDAVARTMWVCPAPYSNQIVTAYDLEPGTSPVVAGVSAG